MKAKSLMLILALIMAIGCGASKSPDPEQEPIAEAVPEPSQEPNEKAVVFVIHPWNLKSDIEAEDKWFFSNFLMPECIRIMEDEIAPKLQEYRDKDVKVYITMPGKDYLAWKEYPKFGVSSCIGMEPIDTIIYDDKSKTVLAKLKAKGVTHIIYMGFATNLCVLGTGYGIENTYKDFNISIIDSCTLAKETEDTLKDKSITKKTIKLIKEKYYKK